MNKMVLFTTRSRRVLAEAPYLEDGTLADVLKEGTPSSQEAAGDSAPQTGDPADQERSHGVTTEALQAAEHSGLPAGQADQKAGTAIMQGASEPAAAPAVAVAVAATPERRDGRRVRWWVFGPSVAVKARSLVRPG